MLDVGFGIIGGRVGDAVPIFNRECGKIAGATGAIWAMLLEAVEGLESGTVERAGGKRGERGSPCFSNGGTHACRGPVCFKLEHLVGCPCSVWIGISTLWLFLSEARCRALRGVRMDGKVAGQQRECCDKFVTHVTELSQKKVFAKCMKPCDAMRPESCRHGPGECTRPRPRADAIPGKIARMEFL